MHAFAAECPAMPGCALSARHREAAPSWIQQFLPVINADAELLRLAVYFYASCTLLGTAELKMS